MHWLPFVVALVVAAIVAPAGVRGLVEAGHTKPNFRAREVAFPLGALVVAAAVLTLVPVALVERLGSGHELYGDELTLWLFVLGVALLGLIDDELGGSTHGVRRHAADMLHARLSTGAVKALGTIGLALLILSSHGPTFTRELLGVAVLALSTHVFNLLDRRPGRAIKAFVALAAALSLAATTLRPLWALGLFVAPVLVLGAYDLRERGMLGDTGSAIVGGLAGLWIVLTASVPGEIVAGAVLLIIALYGEFRSISTLVDRTPGLRALDSWGRP